MYTLTRQPSRRAAGPVRVRSPRQAWQERTGGRRRPRHAGHRRAHRPAPALSAIGWNGRARRCSTLTNGDGSSTRSTSIHPTQMSTRVHQRPVLELMVPPHSGPCRPPCPPTVGGPQPRRRPPQAQHSQGREQRPWAHGGEGRPADRGCPGQEEPPALWEVSSGHSGVRGLSGCTTLRLTIQGLVTQVRSVRKHR